MTPLKFRALHDGTIYKKGWHVVSLDELCEFVGVDYGVPENVTAFTCSQGTRHRTRSTSLHDKNGKEIFEGDVVSWKGQNYQCAWVVGGFTLQRIPNRHPSFRGQRSWGDFAKYIEVIGNIYEHSHLLPKP
jgi:hypothetical protein